MILRLLIVVALLTTNILPANNIVDATVTSTDSRAVSMNLACLFSPKDKITEQLIPLIDNARKSIYAAVYMLTDKKIADALIRAKQRGLKMQLILDPISTGQYGKSDYLAANNIPINIYQTSSKIRPWFSPIMHNKFVIIDETTLWTGSFNWTVSANLTNEENVVISNDLTTCKIFKLYFDNLLATKTAPFGLSNQKKHPERTLRDIITQALASTKTDVELFELLALVLQENSSSGSSVQAIH